MGNIGTTLKRFFTNKNTVTILGVLLGVVVLIIGYNYRINHAVETQSIPYAKTTITATSEITSDNIATIKILKDTIKNNNNIITSTSELLNTATPNCVTYGTSVPEGAFFYREQVVNCNALPNSAIKNMPDGYKPVELPVDIHTTYGNSMYPGDTIDLYVKMTSSDGLVVFGKLIEKIQIADVRDNNGDSVFLTSNAASPSSLLFTVTEEWFDIIMRAKYSGKVEFVPVPGNATYTASAGEMNVTSQYLKAEIQKYAANIPDY